MYPSDFKCIFCSAEVFDTQSVCPTCADKLPYIPKGCKRCGTPLHTLSNVCYHCKSLPFSFQKARSPFVYASPIRETVHNFKYQHAKYLFLPLAQFMFVTYLKEGFACDCIIPIPLHPKRQKERGYNQAELLGNELAKMLKLPLYDSVALRTFETPSQTLLNRKEREENLKNAFEIKNKKLIKNKVILLIDDVFTTGATMEYCSSKLLEAGAKQVFCLTLAHSDFGKQKKNNE